MREETNPSLPARNGSLARICWALFAVSSAFPVAAALMRESKPRWLGVADVVIAAVLAACAMTLATRNRSIVTDDDRLAALRDTHVVAAVVPFLLAIFFLAGERVDWQVLVIGLAWRGWLLVATLPFLRAARTPRPGD